MRSHKIFNHCSTSRCFASVYNCAARTRAYNRQRMWQKKKETGKSGKCMWCHIELERCHSLLFRFCVSFFLQTAFDFYLRPFAFHFVFSRRSRWEVGTENFTWTSFYKHEQNIFQGSLAHAYSDIGGPNEQEKLIFHFSIFHSHRTRVCNSTWTNGARHARWSSRVYHSLINKSACENFQSSKMGCDENSVAENRYFPTRQLSAWIVINFHEREMNMCHTTEFHFIWWVFWGP